MPLKHHPLIMRVEFHQLLLLPCLFSLILTNTILCSSHPNSPQKPQLYEDPVPLGYLEEIDGAHRGTRGNYISELRKYLSGLGYMDADSHDVDIFDRALESALKRYQQFFKLNVTGILDHQTVSHLVGPRCGVADLVNNKSMHPHIWPKRTVTYEFQPGTGPDAVSCTLAALAEWGRVTGIKFQHIHHFERADIKISTKWLDGPAGTAAYAYAPPDGRLFYDEMDSCSDYVGLHEMGHILGLGHSSDPGSIMFPTISPGVRKGLGPDDIKAIRALYKKQNKA